MVLLDVQIGSVSDVEQERWTKGACLVRGLDVLQVPCRSGSSREQTRGSRGCVKKVSG